jgi:uncharacterized membrane protein YdfJ with MMPL/SSD domain
LDRQLRARRGAFLAGWCLVALVSVPFAMRQSDHLTTSDFSSAGSQSAQVDALLQRKFPKKNVATLAVLLWPRKGATEAAISGKIEDVRNAIRGIAGVALDARVKQGALFLAGLKEPVLLPLRVSVNEASAQNIATTLRQRLSVESAGSGEVEVHILGEGALWAGLEATYKRDLAHAEELGFPVVLIVLLAIFGSLAAATLPIVLGVAAVVVTGALIYFLSLAVGLSVFVTNTASMLGIGVAVDYSLIILARIRQELASGRDLHEAREIALKTSGVAVIYSGMTVAASLMGLLLIPNGTLRSMAVGGVIVVAISVVASVTLLPALVELLGAQRLRTRITWSRWRRGRPKGTERRMTWARWTQLVTRHPVISIVGVGGILVTLCLPVLSMKTNTGALSQLSANNDTRLGFAEAAKLGGPGSLGPIEVVAHVRGRGAPSRLALEVSRLRVIARQAPEVHQLGVTEMSRAGAYAFFTATPTVDPESQRAKRLVRHLRRAFATALQGTGVVAKIGGTSAIQADEEHEVSSSMWKVICAVLLLAFLVMTVLLRAVLLPLKAVVMNLLSVGSAYGVLIVVFQWGWFDSVLHYQAPGYLDTLTPPLILAIVFGLSMDYEVFLLSRIRERWRVTGDARGAVSDGLISSARTISSAALILVCVFAVFVGTGVPSIKELGLGAAVAIALDATLIRLVLVPAVMELLGEWSWWMPDRLRRAFGEELARPQIKGEALSEG